MVYFYVNGTPRLIKSYLIALRHYKNKPKHLILLDQYGYNYDQVLPFVKDIFETVTFVTISTKKYSHLDQWVNVYLNPFLNLKKIFKPNSEVILFGLRSPAQKFIISYNKKLGNKVHLYAESIAVDRYFSTKTKQESLIKKLIKRSFSKAFEYQHDYDDFYVYCKDLYRNDINYPKLCNMGSLFSDDALILSKRIFAEEILKPLREYDVVLFGQPLTGFYNQCDEELERSRLIEMIGNEHILIIPHPVEKDLTKYELLPNAKIFRSTAPVELLMLQLLPSRTITYHSTAAIQYAMMNKNSKNEFYPMHKHHEKTLRRFEPFLPNILIHDQYTRS